LRLRHCRKRECDKRRLPLNADVLTTRVADGIAVVSLGSAKRIYFDEEMGDTLTEALETRSASRG
jgi:hypothetical protein